MKRDLVESESGGQVGRAVPEVSFERALKDIQSFRVLPSNWDTYGGQPASEHAAGFCQALLQELKAQGDVAPPLVRPISTGVYLEWQKNGDKLYFEVDEGSVFAAHTSGDTVIFSAEDTDFDVGGASRLVREFYGG